MYHPWLPAPVRFLAFFAVLLTGLSAGCDNGLVPPDAPERGAISGTVSYTGPWPPDSSLFDVRFVALRIVPESADDIVSEFSKQRVVLSNGLDRPATADTFFVPAVTTGPYVYSGVAIQQSSNVFDWVPIGLYDENAGIFQVLPGDTTVLHIEVDFNNIPPFPPVSE